MGGAECVRMRALKTNKGRAAVYAIFMATAIYKF